MNTKSPIREVAKKEHISNFQDIKCLPDIKTIYKKRFKKEILYKNYKKVIFLIINIVPKGHYKIYMLLIWLLVLQMEKLNIF